MKKLLTTLMLAGMVAIGPAFASDDGYDMTNFTPGADSYGSSSFRLTPDMLPKHSYRRMFLMKQYGPRGKPIGFSSVSGKAFDYLNRETVKNKRYAPKGSDPYLDTAYEAPSLDRNYDSSYQQKTESFGNQLKPLGQKHRAGKNPFSNAAGNFFSIPNGENSLQNKPFSSKRYLNKFNSDPTNSSDQAKVFDDESMF